MLMTTGRIVLQTRFERVWTNTTSNKGGGKPFSTPDTMSEVAERLKNYARNNCWAV